MTDPTSDTYTAEELALSGSSERVARRLGVFTPKLDVLAELLVGDMVSEPGGIAWWTDLATPTSILIGDLLADAVASARQSLVEARVAQALVQEAITAQEDRWRRHIGAGGDPRRFPPPISLLDELAPHQADLAFVSFFVSLGRALDCLAATAIGVTDLPADLRRASWPGLRSQSASFSARSDAIEASCGPAGWLAWLLDTRNSIVHRPRQLNLAQNTFLGTNQLHVTGLDNLDRFQLHVHLWRWPQLSWVEALARSDAPGDPYLNDNARLLIDRIFASTMRFLERWAVELTHTWRSRRESGRQQQHAGRQWRLPAVAGDFAGYDSQAPTFSPDYIVLNPATGQRLRAAHVMDDQRAATWGNSTS